MRSIKKITRLRTTSKEALVQSEGCKHK